ncbi:RidA family protein [Oscillatoria sp. FACHB-1407]|uniref:RidA family protein n=1 Tax=Oscillatoria sp. FACHB-1407 TaxID=2692847 RepID=UPI0016875D6E|nr:RidA family protein [Oscillatoria sp. FACHB-1407]MBD2465230.1 RidA family protein [Oscillatoria sp. FACHB-1407]
MHDHFIKRLNPPELPDSSTYGFSQITVVPPGVKLVHIAGQYGADTNDNLISEDFAEQLKQSFNNLRNALAAVGASPEQVVKITILSVDHTMEKLKLISAARNAMWSRDRQPASTLIPVSRLAVDGMLFEIDAVAVIPSV